MRWTALEFNVRSSTLVVFCIPVLICYFVQNQINAHASALLEFDIKAGDTIALWMPESAEKVYDFSNEKTFFNINNCSFVL